MKMSKCDQTKEMIDLIDDYKFSNDIKNHIINCKECRLYFDLSMKLKSLTRNYNNIDLWDYFLIKKEMKKKNFLEQNRLYMKLSKVAIIGLFIIGIIIGINLLINKKNVFVEKNNNKNYIVSNFNHPIEIYDFENNDLDFYYEISLNI